MTTAIFRVPGTASSDLPTLDQLPFPRDQVVAWVKGGHGTQGGPAGWYSSLSDVVTGEHYPAVGTATEFRAAESNGIPYFSYNGGAIGGFEGYLIPRDRFNGADKIHIAAVVRRGSHPKAAGDELNFILRADGDGTTSRLLEFKLGRPAGTLEMDGGFMREGAVDTRPPVASVPVPDATEWYSALLSADFTVGKTELTVDGVGHAETAISLPSSDGWVVPSTASFRVFGYHPGSFFPGDIAELIILRGALPDQAKAMVLGYTKYIARTLNA